MITYIPRVGFIYVKTLTSSFVQILTATQGKNIRGFKAKSRFIDPTIFPGGFDLAFQTSPSISNNVTDGTGYMSFSGAGLGDMLSATNGLWARTRSGGLVVLEITTFC
jgi:hypothetical protein